MTEPKTMTAEDLAWWLHPAAFVDYPATACERLKDHITTQAAQIERLRSAGQRLLDESQHCGEIQYCGDDAISPWEAFRATLKETT